ncbi:hypothetical protein N7457_008815 [Penicillium paradoxum]|uniref:uncharacterized protein n=1 Tax=Penicillium paradoxum TaxID=176176 RepID=UPI002546F641|nr:uncharacterized protein N7457_008815 [Penicillium paradoxum]KAJ5773919.1 hypothetical protein N7457_008815 [Penicillium paradoxum]
MTTFMRLKTPFQARSPITALSAARTQTPLLSQRRSYANKTANDPEQTDTTTHPQDLPNAPIPSNKARPTLRAGTQSPLADNEGHLREDLPEDVKKHNKEMEERYDRPYNRTSDEGKVEPAFQNKG